jgi:hypothetical protein
LCYNIIEGREGELPKNFKKNKKSFKKGLTADQKYAIINTEKRKEVIIMMKTTVDTKRFEGMLKNTKVNYHYLINNLGLTIEEVIKRYFYVCVGNYAENKTEYTVKAHRYYDHEAVVKAENCVNLNGMVYIAKADHPLKAYL